MVKDRTELLREIKDEVVAAKDSPLYEYRIKSRYFPVLGEGNHQAKIVFIGEAPGENEARTGRPFCGPAGTVLDELLESVGINRADVYITNVLKDRPPGNRDPSPEEIAFYSPFLTRQIEIIEPKVIVTLGRFSMRYIMEKFGLAGAVESISRSHGKDFSARGGPAKVITLYHPAVAVHNPSQKEILFKDFEILKRYV